MPYLEIRDADGTHEVPLDGPLTVGRQEDCGLVIDDPRCSKHHCRIEPKGSSWRVVDLASANGTRVNGGEVSQVTLDAGDEIGVGDIALVFRKGRLGVAPRSGAAAESEAAAPVATRRGAGKTWLAVAGLAAAVVIAVFAFKGDDGPTEKPREAAATDERPESVSGSDAGKAAPPAAAPTGLRRDEPRPAPRAVDESGAKLGRRVRGLEKETGADLRAGNYPAVLALYDEVIAECRAAGSDVLARRVSALRVEALRAARAEWESLKETSDARLARGNFTGARSKLERRLDGFAGTNFEDLVRAELRMIGRLEAVAAEKSRAEEARKGEETAASQPGSPTPSAAPRRREKKTPPAALQHVRDGETLAAQRAWGDAAKSFEQAASLATKDEERNAWRLRRTVMHAMNRLKAQVIVNVNDETRAVKSVKIGRLAARPLAADPDIIQLKFGGAGEVTWKWSEIEAASLIDLFSFAAVDPDHEIHFARACLELGDPKRAEKALVAAARHESHRDAAELVFAESRGIDVPVGGFVVEGGRFYTPDEHYEMKVMAQARKLGQRLVRVKAARFDELVAELEALGEPAVEILQASLRARYENVAATWRDLNAVKKAGQTRALLRGKLEERRKAAFALIFDAKRYPYPYGPDQEKVQAEVDALVEEVRAVYRHPSKWLREKNKGVGELDAELRKIASRILGTEQAVAPNPADVLAEIDAVIDMPRHAPSASDQKANDEALKFNAEIKSSITPEEREVHRITNVYRMMMGRRAVKIDEALVRAARGHSQEMKDLGYFAHNSPNPKRRTPGMRVALAGWGGSASENIARGARTPAAAVRNWIGSSGHHRNILQGRHTHLGVGKAADGFFWTQNFGAGTSSSISREKIDPAEPEK